jgi:7-carboxy-7-deazaguanine synthase
MTLQITEIFYSLQGESRTVGWPTVFVRLTGCPLRCGYCDTRYAYSGGKPVAIDDIVRQVADYQAAYVTVTGGEPLAQPGCRALLTQLCDAGYQVSLETSGAVDISAIDARVSIVMDLKTPASGESGRNLWQNIDLLRPQDQLKFVVCDEQDYQWAKQMLTEHQLPSRCEVLLSPAFGEVEGATLADWVLADRLPVRMQLQLHKILWGDQPGR